MKNYLIATVLIGLIASFGSAHPRAAAIDISGTWVFSVDLEDGGHGDPTFVFKQEGEKLTGTYSGPLGEQKVTGTVKGDKAAFGFEASRDGETIKAAYSASIESPSKMTGTVEFSGGNTRGTWTGTKRN
jgi:hypothetical protein